MKLLKKLFQSIKKLAIKIYKHEATSNLIAVKLAIAFLFGILAFPSIQNKYFIRTLGASVVKLHIPSHHGAGGTGFHFKGLDGKMYILTNRHVCKIAENGKLDAEYKGGFYPVKVIKYSDHTDVCLVEAIKGAKPLKLAGSNQDYGDDVFTIGHPLLDDLTLTKGQTGHIRTVELLNDEAQSKEECEAMHDKSKSIKVGTPFGILELEVCVTEIRAMRTNATIHPGSSGSPVLNWAGHIEGIMFAADNRTNWGEYIPLDDIIKFLKEEVKQ